MWIITAVIVGAIIGVLGRLAVPGKQNISMWLTLAVGIVAALLGTALAGAFGFKTNGFWNFWELIFQIGFAAIGVYLVTALMGRSASR